MPTSPPACPECKGSRYIVDVLDEETLATMHIRYRMLAGVGFSQIKCIVCDGRGSLAPDEPPGEYPPCPTNHME